MRNVPNKLARERGQNLKPFILNVLANILASQNSTINNIHYEEDNLQKIHQRRKSDQGYNKIF